MAIEVAKVELKTVKDASGLEACIAKGQFAADEVIAVIGKTEGNGGVNDFTRILADEAFRRVLLKKGKRSEADIAKHSDGLVRRLRRRHHAARHRVRQQRQDRTSVEVAARDRHRHERGTAARGHRPARDGREGRRRGEGRDEGCRASAIPKDVHYVQTKTPLLTIDSVIDAEKRGHHVACEVHDSMGVSNGTTALGIAVALGEIKMPRAEQICKELDLYSSVASCSSGVELTQAQIVLLGNKPGAGGRYRIGHAVMRDALDIDGIYDAIRDAGLELPERPRSSDLGGKVVNCFMKCEADKRGTLRGRRQIMLDDSDVHHHRHSKAAVGGVAAAAIGDPAVFVSVDAMHQGPQGGGPVIAIIDAGE